MAISRIVLPSAYCTQLNLAPCREAPRRLRPGQRFDDVCTVLPGARADGAWSAQGPASPTARQSRTMEVNGMGEADRSIATGGRRELAAGRPVRGLLARPHSRVAGIQLAGWVPKASSPKRYRVVLDADVEVTLPDGTVLRGDLYRPKATGAFPTLLAWSYYPKDLQHTGIPMPINESGPVTNLVARGYCHFNVNARGTGRSDGEFNGLLSPQEQRDVADTIEWTAGQPWCDGNVGHDRHELLRAHPVPCSCAATAAFARDLP